MADPVLWTSKLSGDLGKIDAQSKKLANVELRKYLQETASNALDPAAQVFARATRDAFRARSPFDWAELDRQPGGWRGGVRARPFKKNVRISLLAMGPHDLSKWGRGKMSHPFMGNRSRWYDRSVPAFRGVGRVVGREIKPQALGELGTTVADLLTRRLQ